MKYPNTLTRDLMYSLLISYHSNLPHMYNYDKELGFILGDETKKVVLDIGCGFGSEFIFVMKKYNIQRTIILLDANPLVFKRELPRWYNHSQLDVRKIPEIKRDFGRLSLDDFLKIGADACDIPLKNNSIDIVHQQYMFSDNECLEEDTTGILNEIHRILKKDGIYLYSEGMEVEGLPPTKKDGFKVLKEADHLCSFYYTVCKKL
ncbi:MAG: class I SAM-dependent methyltransferase [Nanoarchaeota archaeon]|nr:class I SAM-dependent methyltransferase [Nanoarchaeota archaeon]